MSADNGTLDAAAAGPPVAPPVSRVDAIELEDGTKLNGVLIVREEVDGDPDRTSARLVSVGDVRQLEHSALTRLGAMLAEGLLTGGGARQ